MLYVPSLRLPHLLKVKEVGIRNPRLTLGTRGRVSCAWQTPTPPHMTLSLCTCALQDNYHNSHLFGAKKKSKGFYTTPLDTLHYLIFKTTL